MENPIGLAVQDFLYREADLLDEWRLTEWEALLADDARYLVPPIGVDNQSELDPDKVMFVVADDREMLRARVVRSNGGVDFAEKPRSRLRRAVTNIRILDVHDDIFRVTANVVVYRSRRSEVTTFIGKYRYRLRRSGNGFLIAEKRVELDIDVLRGQGGISIIL
ncbi:aromatic-ring-hydroxylating dioxygenase subunit beta [Croceicoccus sp. YJ47]|uniref:aromatic-ring-hydroxylating dioxygenase subunit beta n=1 Tax=Croceicoccus sp. YJ47 TaxID=2798724 RepID=UPI0019208237|nr:aromatic-ring-hydroxylating dioxygenase subunit beta [Croceicoccus sp. YJ47]QQN75322.1 aromatic-ring-hydroxylating dioxygenase subunit beta [Croceicoccus sp. YJ47]